MRSADPYRHSPSVSARRTQSQNTAYLRSALASASD